MFVEKLNVEFEGKTFEPVIQITVEMFDDDRENFVKNIIRLGKIEVIDKSGDTVRMEIRGEREEIAEYKKELDDLYSGEYNFDMHNINGELRFLKKVC